MIQCFYLLLEPSMLYFILTASPAFDETQCKLPISFPFKIPIEPTDSYHF